MSPVLLWLITRSMSELSLIQTPEVRQTSLIQPNSDLIRIVDLDARILCFHVL
jgi:hypothetical protein